MYDTHQELGSMMSRSRSESIRDEVRSISSVGGPTPSMRAFIVEDEEELTEEEIEEENRFQDYHKQVMVETRKGQKEITGLSISKISTAGSNQEDMFVRKNADMIAMLKQATADMEMARQSLETTRISSKREIELDRMDVEAARVALEETRSSGKEDVGTTDKPFRSATTAGGVSTERATQLHNMVMEQENVTPAMEAKYFSLKLQEPFMTNTSISSKIWGKELIPVKFRRLRVDENESMSALPTIIEVLNRADSAFAAYNATFLTVLQCFHGGEMILDNDNGEQTEWRVSLTADKIEQYNILRWSTFTTAERLICERTLYQARRLGMCEMFHVTQNDMVLEFTMRAVPLKDDLLLNAKTMLLQMLSVWNLMSDVHKSTKKFSEEFLNALALKAVEEGDGVTWSANIITRMDIIQQAYTTTSGKMMEDIMLLKKAVQHYVDIETKKERSRQTAASLKKILKDDDDKPDKKGSKGNGGGGPSGGGSTGGSAGGKPYNAPPQNTQPQNPPTNPHNKDRSKARHRQHPAQTVDMFKALNAHSLEWHSRINKLEVDELKAAKANGLTQNALGHYGPKGVKDPFDAIGRPTHCKLCGIKQDHRRSACPLLSTDQGRDMCPVGTLSYEKMYQECVNSAAPYKMMNEMLNLMRTDGFFMVRKAEYSPVDWNKGPYEQCIVYLTTRISEYQSKNQQSGKDYGKA
jgi:hypothetical protein